MREAVILSCARTGLAKAGRGSLNATHPAAFAGHALRHAATRARVDAAEIEDVVLGSGHPEGATGYNIGRTAALAAGCPVSTAGLTVNRFCSSGLQAIATAAGYIRTEGAELVAAGACEMFWFHGLSAGNRLVARSAPHAVAIGIAMAQLKTKPPTNCILQRQVIRRLSHIGGERAMDAGRPFWSAVPPWTSCPRRRRRSTGRQGQLIGAVHDASRGSAVIGKRASVLG